MAAVSVPEAARRKGVTRAAIHKAIQRGVLKAHRFSEGGVWFIEEEDLAHYVPLAPQESGRLGGLAAKTRKEQR